LQAFIRPSTNSKGRSVDETHPAGTLKRYLRVNAWEGVDSA
jgi:hypothetical protein